jgi:hypothetical protein
MSRTAKTRKFRKLSQALHRDLSSYGIAASAAGVSVLALAQPAAAQVVYTPANIQIGFGDKVVIDLNHDGITDLTIREFLFNSGAFPGHQLQAIPAAQGGGIKQGGDFSLAAALRVGATVGSSDEFIHNHAVMATAPFGGYYTFGSWIGARNCYLGIQFQIDGATHYGWARLNTSFYRRGRIDALLTGYAYEAQPNKAILAGDEGNGDSPSAEGESIRGQAAPNRTLGALALGTRGECR